MPHLTLYTRQACQLCDEMKATIDRVASRLPITLDVTDIDSDAALAARYGEEIPVLLVDGMKVAKFRIAEAALERTLRARELL